MDYWSMVVVNLAVGLILTLVSAGLAAMWALRRFRHERLWEKKSQTYEKILDAIYDIQFAVATQINATDGREGMKYPHLSAAWKEATNKSDTLLRLRIVSAYIIPKSISSKIDTFGYKTKKYNREEIDSHDYLKIINDFVDDLEIAIKKDLRIKDHDEPSHR